MLDCPGVIDSYMIVELFTVHDSFQQDHCLSSGPIGSKTSQGVQQTCLNWPHVGPPDAD